MVTKKTTKSRSARALKKTGMRTALQPKPAPPLPPQERRRMPWFGWLGLGIMVVNEILLILRVHPVAIIFTAIMWTGYILFVDGWIWARGGTSYFLDGEEKWPMLALISVLIWVMFEAFNFKVKAWEYFNSPNLFFRIALFIWAFATIIPALLRTRKLFEMFDLFHVTHPWKIQFTPFWLSISFVVGLAFTFMPVMFNDYLANLFIPFVWVGLIFLLEPINYRSGVRSVYRDLENGDISFFWQILAAGLLCGILWESWNGQAWPYHGFTWQYHLNRIYLEMSLNKHIGAMPLIGFLGYPPFIWECYALWELIKWAMHGDLLWKPAKV